MLGMAMAGDRRDEGEVEVQSIGIKIEFVMLHREEIGSKLVDKLTSPRMDGLCCYWPCRR